MFKSSIYFCVSWRHRRQQKPNERLHPAVTHALIKDELRFQSAATHQMPLISHEPQALN